MSTKLDYLQKYLCDSAPEKKKKKRVKKSHVNKMVIIDDDISAWKPMEDESVIGGGEYAPIILAIEQSRTTEENRIAEYREKNTWKPIGVDNSEQQAAQAKRKRFDSSEEDEEEEEVEENKPLLINTENLVVDNQSATDDDDDDLDLPRANDIRSESPARKRKLSSNSERNHGGPKVKKTSRWDADSEPKVKLEPGSPKAYIKLEPGAKQELKMTDEKAKLLQRIHDGMANQGVTIVRDMTGKRRDLLEESTNQSVEEAKRWAQLKKVAEWKQGKVQAAAQQSRINDALHEASKPLARFKDDADLDKLQREQELIDDPMLKFIKSKKSSKAPPGSSKPRYSGPWPTNRYNIPPGYRWDGVDRSNGFEKRYFAEKNDRVANVEIAYKWSVEDM